MTTDPLKTVRDALQSACDCFGGYAKHHADKGAMEKSARNAEMCLMMDKALRALDEMEKSPHGFINKEKERLIAEHPHLREAIERLTKCDQNELLMFSDFLRNGREKP